jgi:predicted ATPase
VLDEIFILLKKSSKMKLKSIHIKGYKSIEPREGAKLDVGAITILLGANGVGKSNLVSFFSMLNYMMSGSLQNFIAESGYADSFLYYGSKHTRQISLAIKFGDATTVAIYECTLTHAAGDILIFTEETLALLEGNRPPYTFQLNTGGRETALLTFVRNNSNGAQKESNIAMVFSKLLSACNVFHFHDTSVNAKIRGQGYLEDNQYLNHDAGNLAAFLYRLKENQETHSYYLKIVRYIQKTMPQFGDFELRPSERNNNYILLNWRAKNNPQYLFGPHQISDGSLRFMALATLLLQPPTLLPSVIVLDEPELGLHPSAIAYLAGMIKATSVAVQIIVATQSQRLVDEFELSNIVVVNQDKVSNATTFEYKNPDDLADWLDEYSLSELWEKNVIGGQP